VIRPINWSSTSLQRPRAGFVGRQGKRSFCIAHVCRPTLAQWRHFFYQ